MKEGVSTFTGEQNAYRPMVDSLIGAGIGFDIDYGTDNDGNKTLLVEVPEAECYKAMQAFRSHPKLEEGRPGMWTIKQQRVSKK